MLAELTPAPDQVTIAINTKQMNVMELITERRYAPAPRWANPPTACLYRDGRSEPVPNSSKEHLNRLVAAGIQPHFQLIGSMHATWKRSSGSSAAAITWVR